MDLTRSLEEAGITKVAIVDDDLSERISTDDLSSIDRDLPAVFGDSHDPDRVAYVALLLRLGFEPVEQTDLAEPLSDPQVRQQAPARLREAAEAVLAARHENAEPIRRIRALLEAAGILREHIDEYSTAEIPSDRPYDLIVVDYFLVEGSQAKTLPFIASVLQAREADAAPLQVILMSSHETELKAVFQQLRPELGVSSSRMRIMGKPATDDQLLQWKLALYQLAADRNSVRTIEAFARAAGQAVKQAAADLAKNIWELDLQAMDLLHETALADNDDYCRYMEECLSRQLLTRLEQIPDMRAAVKALDTVLTNHRSSQTISPSAEIDDSRAALRSLMASMEWRGGAVTPASSYPSVAAPLEKAQWVRMNLRFGMVLRSPDGREWLNITQACDLTQASDAELSSTRLLFVGGLRLSPNVTPENEAIVTMTASMDGGATDVLAWNLLWPRTQTIQEFAVEFGLGWSMTGEMRVDQAQSIAAQFAARTARVALPKRLSTWRLQGIAVRTVALREAASADLLAGTAISGHARVRGTGGDEVHIDRDSFDRLLRSFPGAMDDRALRLYIGIQVKRGSKSNSVPPLIYCHQQLESMGALRASFSNEQWLTRLDYADRVILALWPT